MDLFYALAEPKRRKIIEILARDGQLSASEICREFDVTAQAISQHLAILLDAKFVLMERRAQQRLYALNPTSILEVEAWAKQTEKLWSKRLDRLDDVLKADRKKSR